MSPRLPTIQIHCTQHLHLGDRRLLGEANVLQPSSRYGIARCSVRKQTSFYVWPPYSGKGGGAKWRTPGSLHQSCRPSQLRPGRISRLATMGLWMQEGAFERGEIGMPGLGVEQYHICHNSKISICGEWDILPNRLGFSSVEHQQGHAWRYACDAVHRNEDTRSRWLQRISAIHEGGELGMGAFQARWRL